MTALVEAPDPAHALVWVSQGNPSAEWLLVPEGGETSMTSDPELAPESEHTDDDDCQPYSGPEGELDPNDK